MIRPTFLAFETAKRALSVSQAGLDIVGHNISNAQTAGYTRQRVDQVSFSMNGMSSRYSTFGSGNANYGAGSLFNGVSQLRDVYLDNRYRAEAATTGELGVKADGLTDINNIFDEIMSDGGLYTKMGDLMNAIAVLGQSANTKEHAMVVRDTVNQLVQILNKNAQQLEDSRAQQMLDLQTTVDQDVNTLLEKIASLNKQIKEDHFYGNPSNELNDERNLLMDKLSEYLDITIVRTPTQVSADLTIETVSIELNNSGTPPYKLVDGSSFNPLEVTEDPVNGNAVVSLLDGISGLPLVDDLSNSLLKGGIKGFIDIINGGGPKNTDGSTFRGIPYYMDALDEYAQNLAEIMNRINNISQQEAELSGSSYDPVISGSATDWIQSIEGGDFSGKNTNVDFVYDGSGTVLATYTDETGTTQVFSGAYPATGADGKITFSNVSGGGNDFTIVTKSGISPPLPSDDPRNSELLVDAGWPPVTSTSENKNLLVPLIPTVTDSTGNQPEWINTVKGGVMQFSGKEYNIEYNYDDVNKTMTATMKDANGNILKDDNGKDMIYTGSYDAANGIQDIKFRDSNGSIMFTVNTTSEPAPANTPIETNLDAKINAKNIAVSQNWFDDPLYITTSKSNAPNKKEAAITLDGTKNPSWLTSVSMGPDSVAVPNGTYQFKVSTSTPPEISVTISGIEYKGAYQANGTIELKGGLPEKVGLVLVTNSKAITTKDEENVATVRNDTGARNDNINKLLTEMKASSNYEVSGIKGGFQEFLVAFQAQMGLDKNLNTSLLDASLSIMSAFADRRDSISAVSIDEEGINMMTYQNYYNAAARYMTTLDEALDKIINGMGVVGR